MLLVVLCVGGLGFSHGEELGYAVVVYNKANDREPSTV